MIFECLQKLFKEHAKKEVSSEMRGFQGASHQKKILKYQLT